MTQKSAGPKPYVLLNVKRLVEQGRLGPWLTLNHMVDLETIWLTYMVMTLETVWLM